MAIMSCHFTDHPIYGIDWLRLSKKERKMKIRRFCACVQALTFFTLVLLFYDVMIYFKFVGSFLKNATRTDALYAKILNS